MITEKPDGWKLIKLPDGLLKVFASWNDNSWKLNSGVKEIKEDDNYYYFIGFSGSCYKCKRAYQGRLTFYNGSVYYDLLSKSGGRS